MSTLWVGGSMVEVMQVENTDFVEVGDLLFVERP